MRQPACKMRKSRFDFIFDKNFKLTWPEYVFLTDSDSDVDEIVMLVTILAIGDKKYVDDIPIGHQHQNMPNYDVCNQ